MFLRCHSPEQDPTALDSSMDSQWRRNRSGRSGFGRYTFLGRELIFITCYKASLVPWERAHAQAASSLHQSHMQLHAYISA